MTPRQDPPGTGALGEEVLHLFADLAAARRARAAAGAGDGAGADDRPTDHAADPGASGSHPSTCSWCPVCQAVDVVRDASPQVLQHLGDSLESLAAAVRELSAHLARDRAPAPTGTTAPDAGPAAGVQPIDLAEDGPWH